VKPPKPGRGRKKHDAPVKPDALHGASYGERLVAAYQGRFEATPTTFAELLAGFVQLSMRLPKADLPHAAKTHSFEIQQATDLGLPGRIEAIGRDLGITLQSIKPEALPDLLRKVADVIASRPLQPHREGTGHMVLKPTDPVTVAAHFTAWRHAAKKLPSQRIITKAEMLQHLRAMPKKARLDELRKLGATEDDRTLRRKLTALFPGLQLAPGRPRKPDK
jgi:hypothetical protein